MKKIFAIFAIVLVFATTSCGNKQVNTETEVAADSTAVEVVDTTATVDVAAVDSTTVETAAEAVAE